MTLSIISEPVPLSVDPDGVVRVAETRVTLDTIVLAFKDGSTAEQIVQEYPALELADIYAVLGYYLRRTEEVESYLRDRQEKSMQVRQKTQARANLQGIRERLEARRTQSGG